MGKVKLPVIKNYTPYKGDDFTRSFTIMRNGALIDLSGDTFKMRIKDASTGEVFLDLESGSGITNPSIGRIVWTVTNAQSEDFISNRKYKYDLQWTRSDGINTTLQRGTMIPEQDETPT